MSPVVHHSIDTQYVVFVLYIYIWKKTGQLELNFFARPQCLSMSISQLVSQSVSLFIHSMFVVYDTFFRKSFVYKKKEKSLLVLLLLLVLMVENAKRTWNFFFPFFCPTAVLNDSSWFLLYSVYQHKIFFFSLIVNSLFSEVNSECWWCNFLK